MRRCMLLPKKMASTAKSLEDMLSSDVDESAVSALVGSLESQLSSPTSHTPVSHTSAVNSNHVNNSLIADHALTSTTVHQQPVATQKLSSSNVSSQSSANVVMPSIISNSDIVLKQASVSVPRINVSRPVVMTASSDPVRVVSAGEVVRNQNQTGVIAQVSSGHVTVPLKINATTNNGVNVNGSNDSSSNHPHQFTPQVLPNGNIASGTNNAQTPCSGNLQPENSSNPAATNSNILNSSTVLNNSVVSQSVAMVTMPSSTPTVVNALKTSMSSVISVAKQTAPANVLTQVVSSQGNVLQGVQIVNVNPNNMRTVTNPASIAMTQTSISSPIVSNATPQKALAPRVVIGNPVRIAGGQQVIAARPTAPNAIQNTITLQPGMVRGTLLVKTENGQYQLVNVGPALTPSSNASSIPGTGAYRLQASSQGQTRTMAPQQLAVSLPVSATNGPVKVHQTMANASSMQQTISSHAAARDSASMHHVRLHGNSPIPVSARPHSYPNISSSLHHRPSHPSMPARNIIVERQPVASSNTAIGQPLSVQTTIATPASATVSSSQMSPDTAKKKCTNFLSTLIRLAGDQPEQVAKNVKNLIQGLIDGTVNPEDFTVQLQKELHSSPQPCLVPFLKKSLPYLRHSLATKELTIQGVRPPPPGTLITLPSVPQSMPTIQLSQSRPQGSVAAQQQQHIKILSSGIPPTRLAQPASLRPPNQRSQPAKGGVNKVPSTLSSMSPATVNALQAKSAKAVVQAPGKEKTEKRAFSSLRDDDDINDVAAMGGVNLVEESAKILAVNSELVGTQIRSCKDENFLFTSPLHRKIKQIVSKFELDDPSPEVISLISHAAQERLKSLVQKLGAIAEHRMEIVKTDPKYEVMNNTRAQVKFLEELDKLERKRHEEEEREILLRAAKSRSKVEDPEQQKLKLKAKEMQRQELEEMRQREANTTALLAIGPRKKFKSDQSATASNSQSGTSTGSTGVSSRPVIRQRVKRVNLRDLFFLMEQERETCKSTLLYKSMLK